MTDLHVIPDLDHRGYPIVLAAPEPVAPKPTAPSIRPASVRHDEWTRRQDAVREAAREFEVLTEQDLKERLKGITLKPLEESDLAQFRVDVRAQVLDDLVDYLDHRTRGVLRGRRMVKVSFPRGYAKKLMRSLDAGEADQVEARLRARGWGDAEVKKDLRSKLAHLEPVD